MTRIKIRGRPNGRARKNKLLEILSKRDTEVSRILYANDRFIVLTYNEHFADCIFIAETKQELSTHDFTPVMPPELKGNKSVIIPRVDDIVYENSTADTSDEIFRRDY